MLESTEGLFSYFWKLAEETSIHQLGRAAQVTIFRLRTGHCQLLSHLHSLKISQSYECPCGTGPQTPTTSCSPVPPLTLWDARHGPVRWMPTGSFGDWLSHCGRLRTMPYSLDWRSGMASNAEKENLLQGIVQLGEVVVLQGVENREKIWEEDKLLAVVWSLNYGGSLLGASVSALKLVQCLLVAMLTDAISPTGKLVKMPAPPIGHDTCSWHIAWHMYQCVSASCRCTSVCLAVLIHRSC